MQNQNWFTLTPETKPPHNGGIKNLPARTFNSVQRRINRSQTIVYCIQYPVSKKLLDMQWSIKMSTIERKVNNLLKLEGKDVSHKYVQEFSGKYEYIGWRNGGFLERDGNSRTNGNPRTEKIQ